MPINNLFIIVSFVLRAKEFILVLLANIVPKVG
jgi:hypothetical protein